MGLGERGLGPCLSGPPPPMSQGVIQGTVPYLGTFLTDLVMLDTAMKDYLYVSAPRGWAGLAGGPWPCTLSRGRASSHESLAPVSSPQGPETETDREMRGLPPSPKAEGEARGPAQSPGEAPPLVPESPLGPPWNFLAGQCGDLWFYSLMCSVAQS